MFSRLASAEAVTGVYSIDEDLELVDDDVAAAGVETLLARFGCSVVPLPAFTALLPLCMTWALSGLLFIITVAVLEDIFLL